MLEIKMNKKLLLLLSSFVFSSMIAVPGIEQAQGFAKAHPSVVAVAASSIILRQAPKYLTENQIEAAKVTGHVATVATSCYLLDALRNTELPTWAKLAPTIPLAFSLASLKGPFARLLCKQTIVQVNTEGQGSN
jgi:hypothetical protein